MDDAMTDQILFDKLVYMDRLKAAGIAEEQARAHADAMDEALREAVATKADIRELKSDNRETVTRLTMLMWAVGINIALSLGVLGKLLK